MEIPREQWQSETLRWFVGKLVRAPFRARTPDGRPTYAHLWVRVTSVHRGQLMGRLESEPAPGMRRRKGDEAFIERKDVEAVMAEDAA